MKPNAYLHFNNIDDLESDEEYCPICGYNKSISDDICPTCGCLTR